MSFYYYNQNLSYSSIEIDGNQRFYIMTGTISSQYQMVKLLFCFPGGNETAFQFTTYTNVNECGILSVIFQGQPSKNNESFMNSYPWYGNDPLNDMEFVKQVYQTIPTVLKFGNQNNTAFKNITVLKDYLYLTGKSDGSGFCVYLAYQNPNQLPIKALFLVSSALFCLNSTQNYGTEVNINLLTLSIPTILLHGTSDTTMPYYGENFVTEMALCGNIDYWQSIDTNIVRDCPNQQCTNPTNVSTNTYTADIPAYVNNWNGNYQVNTSNSINNSVSTFLYYKLPHYFLFVPIINGTHVWFGHDQSGPDANEPANLVLDSTDLLCQLLNIPLASYEPTIPTNIENIPILT